MAEDQGSKKSGLHGRGRRFIIRSTRRSKAEKMKSELSASAQFWSRPFQGVPFTYCGMNAFFSRTLATAQWCELANAVHSILVKLERKLFLLESAWRVQVPVGHIIVGAEALVSTVWSSHTRSLPPSFGLERLTVFSYCLLFQLLRD